MDWSIPIPQLPFTWKEHFQESTLIPGWQDLSSFLGCASHVSASACTTPYPSSLLLALKPSHLDHTIWLDSYAEEYQGLLDHNVFYPIKELEYCHLTEKHGLAIPCMCVLVIKKDQHGTPIHAKNHIIILGNHDHHTWSKGNCFTPVMAQSSVHLLISLAVQHCCIAKQCDCKNTFCSPTLPDIKVVII